MNHISRFEWIPNLFIILISSISGVVPGIAGGLTCGTRANPKRFEVESELGRMVLARRRSRMGLLSTIIPIDLSGISAFGPIGLSVMKRRPAATEFRGMFDPDCAATGGRELRVRDRPPVRTRPRFCRAPSETRKLRPCSTSAGRGSRGPSDQRRASRKPISMPAAVAMPNAFQGLAWT